MRVCFIPASWKDSDSVSTPSSPAAARLATISGLCPSFWMVTSRGTTSIEDAPEPPASAAGAPPPPLLELALDLLEPLKVPGRPTRSMPARPALVCATSTVEV